MFPGLAALVPTLGTAAIILANSHRQTLVGNLLAFPVFIWIGLISYSLYLWHWPVLVLAKQYLNRVELHPSEVGGLLGLTFALSIASYWLVETPFRTKKFLANRWSMIIAGVAMLGIMVGAGLFIMKHEGLPERAPEVVQAITAASLDFAEGRDECFVNAFTQSDTPCIFGDPETADRHLVLWGDSHGAALLPAFSELASEHGVMVSTFLAPGCLPVSGQEVDAESKKCARVGDLARAHIVSGQVEDVVLVGRWSGITTTDDVGAEGKYDLFAIQLRELLHELRLTGVTATVVQQVPLQAAFDERTLFYEAARSGTLELTETTKSEHALFNSAINQLFRALEEEGQLKQIDPATVLCGAEVCSLQNDGVILYQDADHLNRTGALFAKPAFTELFSDKEE